MTDRVPEDGPDTTNDSFVGVQGDRIVILRPRARMTKPEALRLAAWLVVLADEDQQFSVLLDAVRGL
jgi:hypothetical protein